MDPVPREHSKPAFPVESPTGGAGHGRPAAVVPQRAECPPGRVKRLTLATGSVLLALGQAAVCQGAPPARAPSGWRPTVQLQDRLPQQPPAPASALYRRDLRGALRGPARLMVGPEWTDSGGLRLALLVPVESRPFSPTAHSPDAGTWNDPLPGAQVQVGMKLEGGEGRSAWRGALSFDVGRQTQLAIKPRARRVSVTLHSTW